MTLHRILVTKHTVMLYRLSSAQRDAWLRPRPCLCMPPPWRRFQQPLDQSRETAWLTCSWARLPPAPCYSATRCAPGMHVPAGVGAAAHLPAAALAARRRGAGPGALQPRRLHAVWAGNAPVRGAQASHAGGFWRRGAGCFGCSKLVVRQVHGCRAWGRLHVCVRPCIVRHGSSAAAPVPQPQAPCPSRAHPPRSPAACASTYPQYCVTYPYLPARPAPRLPRRPLPTGLQAGAGGPGAHLRPGAAQQPGGDGGHSILAVTCTERLMRAQCVQVPGTGAGAHAHSRRTGTLWLQTVGGIVRRSWHVPQGSSSYTAAPAHGQPARFVLGHTVCLVLSAGLCVAYTTPVLQAS